MSYALGTDLAETQDFPRPSRWERLRKVHISAPIAGIAAMIITVVVGTRTITRQATALEQQKQELEASFTAERDALVAAHQKKIVEYRGHVDALNRKMKAFLDPERQFPGVLEVGANLEARTVLYRRSAIASNGQYVDLANGTYSIVASAMCEKADATTLIARAESGEWFFVHLEARHENVKKITLTQGKKVRLGF